MHAGTPAEVSSNAQLHLAPSPATPPLGESASVEPMAPRVMFHGQATTFTEVELDAKGFPAISADGRLVGLAFHELNTTGPPVLELRVQLRSVASGQVVHAFHFREAYRGELDPSSLDRLKKRILAWVDDVNLTLTRAKLTSIVPVVRDEAAVCNNEAEALRVPTTRLRVQFNAGHLVVSDETARAIFERSYPQWTVTNGGPTNRCVYSPHVAEVAFDAPSRVLVVKAEHCSPSDMCLQGIAPNFAIVALP